MHYADNLHAIRIKLFHCFSENQEDLPEDCIFQRKTFLIMGFEKEAEDSLRELIEERKGKVLSMASRVVPDCGIVPILGFPLTRTVNEVVTNAWLVSIDKKIVRYCSPAWK